MPLITQDEKIPVRVKIDVGVKSEIEAYCKWAKVKDMGFFLGKAAEKIFSHDKEWQEHCKKTKRS